MELRPRPHPARRDPQGGADAAGPGAGAARAGRSPRSPPPTAPASIHRDVKPENVLIADDGRVKVADFGLAKAVSADTQHTATGGVLIGTVSYLAPELVVDGRADARADVYAAGVVLYELLTGAQAARGRVADPGRLQARPRGRAAAVQRGARASRRTSTRWSPGPPPATASQRPADARVLLHQVHRVEQALAEGVLDDPELTADLAPPLAVVVLEPELDDLEVDRARRARLAADARTTAPTTSQQDRERTARSRARDRYDDTTDDRPARPPGARSPATPPRRSSPTRGVAADRPRRSRRGLVLLLVALLLAVGGGAGAWWFGFGPLHQRPPASSG